MAQESIALVLGATGGIGGEVARRLAARGWRVRALHRAPEGLAERERRFDWLQGDAMIVHAVNPPGYRNWAGLVLPMVDNTIAAARASGARILLPGTVYNYGPDALTEPCENSPQRPLTRKGAIRAELERRLQAAALDGVRSLVVRAGDFFGPGAGNNWFSGGLIRAGVPLRAITYPGRPGVGHQWAYVPDVAETMVCLVERDDPAPFDSYHMQGHWDADGTEMIASIRRTAGRTDIATRRFPWWTLPVMAPFSETLREVLEMRYLWQQPVRMSNRRLVDVLGEEPHTPWDEAVGATLRSMGCV
jgi:nucleoside-diphosphate-sugar epimerase